MKNEAMPEGKEYVMVTRARMPKSQRVIVHVYGPYTQKQAKAHKSTTKRDFPEAEVSVCHVLDPESWST